MEVYGLIGSPVDHSLSPVMFEAAFEERDIDAVYATYHVESDDCLRALDGATALGIDGLNVTIPHKETVLEWATPTEVADRIGAANVIDLSADPPKADNTDAHAMTTVLSRLDQPPESALVVGAGGAAKAYVHALTEAGWEVTVANRTLERAQSLADRYESVSAIQLSQASDSVPETTLILNATPVGMQEDVTPLSTDSITAEHIVVDAVYRPVETRLLSAAATAGAQTVTGLTLLLEQGVATFERWREEDPPRRAMRVALEEAIEALENPEVE